MSLPSPNNSVLHTMIAAGILFLSGILIGLLGTYLVLVMASLVATLVMISYCVMSGGLGLVSIPIWLGYLLALQSGFLVGGYVRTRDGS